MKTITFNVDDDDARAIADVLRIFAEQPFHDLPEGESDEVGGVIGEVCRAWMDLLFIVPPSQESTCIGCGCTDNQACEGGCDWLAENRVTRRGVCSSCPSFLEAFAAEQRVQEFRESLA